MEGGEELRRHGEVDREEEVLYCTHRNFCRNALNLSASPATALSSASISAATSTYRTTCLIIESLSEPDQRVKLAPRGSNWPSSSQSSSARSSSASISDLTIEQ